VRWTWLLGVHGGHGSLWRYGGNRAPLEPTARLGAVAVEARTLADVLAANFAVLPAPEVRWPADAVLRALHGEELPASLDGASLGLPCLVLALAERLGMELPGNVCMMGEVTADGRIVEVEGIAEKARVVAEQAARPGKLPGGGQCPAITTLILPRGNEGEARAVLAAAGAQAIQVVAVDSAWQGADAALGTGRLHETVVARLCAHPGPSAERLLEVVLAMRGPMPWREIAAVAGPVAAKLRGNDDKWFRASVAEAVAARHTGEPRGLPTGSWGWIAGLRPPLGKRLAAHVVQGAADSIVEPWEDTRTDARALLPSLDQCGPEDAEILGAIGRLEAAWGRYEDACSSLRRAVATWGALLRVPDSSIAVCEWLRAARLGSHGDLADAQAAVVNCYEHPGTSAHSRGFLAVAMGRDAALRPAPPGSLAEATRWLHSLDTPQGEHQAEALRWLAIAGSEGAEAKLEAMGASVKVDLALARMARGDAASEADIAASPPHAPDLGRLRGWLGDVREIARQWRY
jgi:hypothetical protein